MQSFCLNLLFAYIVITGLSIRFIGLIPGFIRHRLYPFTEWQWLSLEETQMTWCLSLLLHCLGVHFTMRYQAAANHTVLISLLFSRHRGDFI